VADLGKYFTATGPIGGSVSAQNLLSLENPVGSGINVLVHKIRAHGVVTAISTGNVEYRLSRTTALPSSGTVLTPMKRLGAEPANVAVARSGPTATSTTNYAKRISAGLLITAVGQLEPQIVEMFQADEEQYAIRLAPNTAILVDASANLAAWSHYVEIEWTEVSQ
jgi:hypothetical protein